MRVVEISEPGDADVLRVVERPTPGPGINEVLVAVEASGVSRADVAQRKGNYPPPPAHSDIPGLEVAGTIAAVGANVRGWHVGDRVCALVNGGGYAEFAIAPAPQVLIVPKHWTTIEAASLPENAFTVYDALFARARLQRRETVLVHGGTSGIGTTAIMFAKALEARVIVTAGSQTKCAAARDLGADLAIDYKTADFVEEVRRFTGGAGVDVVLDMVGGAYIARDLDALALDGRIVCIATLGGSKTELDIAALMRRRGTIAGSSLRPRTVEQKGAIAKALRERIWPLLPKRNPIVPVIDSTFTFEQAAQAHQRMESSAHIGKIVLTPRPASP
ncbi:MAG: NAD(P)H-quinone oxidoreductase [Candidatus Eremiobacteraeota bacterium]|nr:NAD(P)H-quinone oxidoreductase [Candidatus Eremiobacteraeota bacterium]